MLWVNAWAASFSRQVTGLDFAQFEDRECIILRTAGGVPVPAGFARLDAGDGLAFDFPYTGADGVTGPPSSGDLIRSIALEIDPRQGTRLIVGLASAGLAHQSCFRFTQPSEHVLLLEVFATPEVKGQVQPITNLSDLVAEVEPATSIAAASAPASQPEPETADPLASIPLVDLNGADPQRVLSLAAGLGLLKPREEGCFTTERWGEVSVSPAGQSLVSWTEATPPGELLLCGSPAQIAQFLAQASPEQIAAQPRFAQYWATEQPRQRARSLAGGASADTRARVKDDPYNGLYYASTVPGGGRLSDVRVTLNAANGMNLYDVLNYLSYISGISLIIDPYAFAEPTGGNRPPLMPDGGAPDENGPGFRSGSVFEPSQQRSGTVRGNFVNVPFDELLRTILATHELEFVVMSEGQPAGKRYGGRGDKMQSYEKPVLLVTSRERLEQELPGTNEIDLQQFHYADPYQVTEILQEFGLVSSSGTGWYIYDGGGAGSGGVGRGGGGRPGGGSGSLSTLPSVIAYQGSTREPVREVARTELAAGRAVARVILSAERDTNELITLLCR